MPKAQDILGMNARNQLFGKLNDPQTKSFCSSKYATKALFLNKGIPTAAIFGVLATSEDIQHFDWNSLEKNFVIKPTNGNAGKGIIALRKRVPHQLAWIDTLGRKWTLEDIELHCSDIIEGAYSTYGSQHNVLIEERIVIHPLFRRFVKSGTPDIRIIVFNQVPVMAMLRLPTEESEGRANLHQGAIGVGIDLGTGITTSAITGTGTFIHKYPNSNRNLKGIKLPKWKKTLATASEAAEAANLKYCGIDLFLDEEQGPMVVEINFNPGLSIQLANRAGLRRRLERVQGINVLNPEHGVRIGRSLFAENFWDEGASDGMIVITPNEELTVIGDQKQKVTLQAQVNTGRYRSAIASEEAGKLGLIDLDDLLWFQQESGEGQVPVVDVTFILKKRKIKTSMVVSKRLNNRKHKVILGRIDLKGFLVGEST